MNALIDTKMLRNSSSALRAGPIEALLSPVQASAYARLGDAMKAAPIVALAGEGGSGKTTLLRALASEMDGEYLTIEALVRLVRQRDPLVCADTVLMAVEDAFSRSDLVIVEDMVALTKYSPHPASAPVSLEILFTLVAGTSRRLVFAAAEDVLKHDFRRCEDRIHTVTIGAFGAEDYATILRSGLTEAALANVDMALLWRHAPGLSGHDLRTLSNVLRGLDDVSTAVAIQQVNSLFMTSNVRQQEVEALSFASLPGSEAIAAKLETHIMLPLERQDLADRLDIRPKRGALLYGPPGTGKTSIGRALAHRMGGKFFLIDGSFPTEPPVAFFARVTEIVKEAKENAPSVLFVDDADVLFGIPHIAGFSRYLLSLLDGVESESAGRVCLMMTAMNASRIPASILRSGRVELWLETRVPDATTRARIIERWLGEGFPGAADVDFTVLSAKAEGFTPADLRRIVTDAKSLHAMDVMTGTGAKSGHAYLEQAIADLVEVRGKMAENLRDESLRIASLYSANRPAGKRGNAAKYGAGIGGLAASGETCGLITGNL